MACHSTSLKEFLAPVSYYTIHAILVAGVLISTSALRNLDDLPHALIFWIVVIATGGLYLALRFKDPGFVPYDAIFFTDQDQGAMNSVGNRTNSKSMGSKAELNPALHAQVSLQIDAQSKVVEERIFAQESNREKSSLDSIPPSLSDLRLPDKPDSTRNKEGSPGSGEIRCENIEIRDVRVEIQDSIQRNMDVVACEPSVDDEEVFDFHQGSIMMDDNNKENEDINVGEHQRRLQAENSILRTLPNNIEEKDNGSGSLNSTKPHDHYKSVTQLSHEIEFDGKQTENNFPLKEIVNDVSINRRREIFENSCDIQLQTGDDDENKKVNMEEIRVKAQRTGDFNPRKIHNHLNKNVTLFKLQEKQFISPKKETDNNPSSVQSVVEKVITKGDESNKEMTTMNNKVETSTKQENRDSTKIEVNESYKNVKEDGGELFFVERRYCIICNIEQPIRSKHCKNCNKCVARYDHHCPWIGTCIGEKNHQLFYWFLLFQLVELCWADVEVISSIVNDDSDNWVAPNVGRIILALIISGFFLFVTSLVLFQTYLIISNLTTWEKLSWNKITYMKDWEKRWGSPFSKGVGQNLSYFFLKSKKELRRWRLPKVTKDLDNSQKST